MDNIINSSNINSNNNGNYNKRIANSLFLIVSTTIVILACTLVCESQSSPRDQFIEKIDYYLNNEYESTLKRAAISLSESSGLSLDQISNELIEEIYIGALKRIKDRLLNTNNNHMLSEEDNYRFTPPIYNQTVIDAFASKVLLNPEQNLTYNPYDIAGFNTTQNDSVCAVYYPDESNRSTYYLVNFTSASEAEAAGAYVTHLHTCGYCSTTKDLSSYMAHMDLTSPIRDCAITSFISDEISLECIQHTAGFTYNCAVIWLYDALNTRKDCLEICLYDYIMHTPNNVPPNSTNLNPCLQCDEDKSGPIFKVVAGRTRRDSGLKSAINRPPDSVYNITHYYY